jgi:hypothetical protein
VGLIWAGYGFDMGFIWATEVSVASPWIIPALSTLKAYNNDTRRKRGQYREINKKAS